MIQLRNFKKDLYLNADKYLRAHQKDRITLQGFDLQIGTRLRGSVTNNGQLRKFYMMVISLEPEVIAYWIEGEYAIYLEYVNFATLFKKRDIKKRTSSDKNLHPQNFRILPAKTLNAAALRTLLWNLPRLSPAQIRVTQNTLVLKDPRLIYDFAEYLVMGKEDVLGWMLTLAKTANDIYHGCAGKSPLTDDEFDDLKEYLLVKDNKRAKFLTEVGSDVTAPSREKVKLPYSMGSQEKIKPGTGKLKQFLAKTKDGFYIISDKLDGISLQFGYKNGKLVFASTRGKGLIGKTVLRHTRYLNIPQSLKGKYAKGEYNIRAEAILTQQDFRTFKDTVFKNDKTKEPYNDARTMVGGCLNRTDSKVNVFSKLKIISYSIMNLDTTVDKETQLKMLDEMGFTVVHYRKVAADKITDDMLVSHIGKRKDVGGHELDGAVIEANNAKIRARMGNEVNSLNPAFSRAFKTGQTETKEMEVKEIECNVSKHSVLVPKIIFKTPTMLGGVMVKQTAAFNYGYIRDNKLGPGSVLLMTRSGDVIPYIVKVVKGTKAQYPDAKIFGEYSWDDTKVNLVLDEKGVHEDSRIKTILDFFTTCGIENIKSGTLKKFYDAGFDTIDEIINMSVKDMLSIEGIQQASANKIYGNIHSVLGNIELPKLAAATPFFGRGFGTTRMDKIYDVYKDKMFEWPGYKVSGVAADIAKIKGFSLETGLQFAKGINEFKAFLRTNKNIITVKAVQKKKVSGVLSGMSFLWSKVRQHEVEQPIKNAGGEVLKSFKTGLTYLVCPEGETSVKIDKAKKLGTKVLTPEQLLKLLKSKGVL